MKDGRYKKGFVTTRGELRWNRETQRFETVRRDGYEYEGPWALAHTNANFVQQNWRFRNDDGTLVTATWIKAEDTAVVGADGIGATTKFRIRFNLGDDANADSNNVGTPTLQYRVNTGGGFGSWTAVPTTAGADGIAFASSDQAITDGDNDSTQRLSTIAGSTYQGSWNEYDENTSQTSRTYTDDYCEFEYCLVTSAGTGGNVYEFRLLSPTGSLPDTPPSTDASLTVEAAAADLNISATLATLNIAAQNATVNLTREIATVLVALNIAAQNGTVNPTREIQATLAVLGIASQVSDINLTREIAATLVALNIASQNATVVKGINLTPASIALNIAAQNASINASREIAATLKTLNIAPQTSTVERVRNIQATLATLSIQAFNATVDLGGAVAAIVRRARLAIKGVGFGL